jgi:hypothetical protein
VARSPDRATLLTEGLPNLQETFGRCGCLLKDFAVITQEYRLNRPRFPQTQLAAYQGQWVAFSSDGRRIVGCGSTVGELETELAKAGEVAQQVVFEWVAGPEEDSLAPGGDLV